MSSSKCHSHGQMSHAHPRLFFTQKYAPCRISHFRCTSIDRGEEGTEMTFQTCFYQPFSQGGGKRPFIDSQSLGQQDSHQDWKIYDLIHYSLLDFNLPALPETKTIVLHPLGLNLHTRSGNCARSPEGSFQFFGNRTTIVPFSLHS